MLTTIDDVIKTAYEQGRTDAIKANEIRELPRCVICDLCGRETYGTRTALGHRGWYFGRGEEICPDHD